MHLNHRHRHHQSTSSIRTHEYPNKRNIKMEGIKIVPMNSNWVNANDAKRIINVNTHFIISFSMRYDAMRLQSVFIGFMMSLRHIKITLHVIQTWKLSSCQNIRCEMVALTKYPIIDFVIVFFFCFSLLFYSFSRLLARVFFYFQFSVVALQWQAL